MSKLAELPQTTCLYHGGQKNEEGLLAFCGSQAKSGYNYCADHYRRIYQRAPTAGELRALAADREAA